MAVAVPPAGAVTLTYDGDGKRLGRQTPTQTRQFVYDLDKILQETDGFGTTTEQYASTEQQYGDLLSAYGGGQARYFAGDALGSTDALLATDGSASDRYAYRAFGLASHYAGTDDNHFSWVGKQGYYEDREQGLYFLKDRYYDPLEGRFLSRDPAGFEAGDANLYRYVFNDPLNKTDPSGHGCGWFDFACQAQAVRETIQVGWEATTGFVKEGVEAVGSAGSSFLDTGAKIARLGIDVLLRQFNVDPNSFWEVVSEFGSKVSGLLTSGLSIARKVINGIGLGLKQFFENFGEHAKEGVFSWLFGDLQINWDLIPEEWTDWKGWLAFFADLVAPVGTRSWRRPRAHSAPRST